MNNYLVLSALGTDKPGLVDKLSQTILEQNLNIEDSRMSVLGGEFAIMLLLTGSENQLTSFEKHLQAIQNKLDELTITIKRTRARRTDSETMPYKVEVMALDNPGIVNSLASFFSQRQINIEDMHTQSYAAPHTGSQMFSVNMTIGIPASTKTSQLREEFITHCDNLNLDATLESSRS